MRSKISAVMDLIRLPKQYGTLLLMMPTLWALFLAAEGTPPLSLVLIFIAGCFIMRSAGCVINDIADRNFDGHVERTRSRPIPSGRLTTGEALVVFAVLLVMALILVSQLNPLTRALSIGGALLATLYPFSKRFTHFPQVVMGATFGWGSIMAWTAVRGSVDLPVFLIFFANLFWATAYDTIYAIMDRDDDLRIGVKSTAIFFGPNTWIGVSFLFGLSALF
ncbi:MAG TPA: 4-hydroxybenzoate octaprenyltransferase, partial [Nitrospiria bacterium]|nr:4-hydroxybenzoate octaprenyltransferase [Nitrospiria bacterium]